MRARVRLSISSLARTALALTLLLGAASAGAKPLRVVILPIIVHSAGSADAYVSEGLADMLSSRLEQLGELTVLRAGERGTTELAQALETASGTGADYVIYGAFTQFGDGASLDIHCAPTAGRPEQVAGRRRIFIQSGNVSEIIPKLDELVDRIAFFLNRPASAPAPGTAPAADAADATGGADSAELEALRERVDALEQAVYGLDDAGTDAAALSAEEAAPES